MMMSDAQLREKALSFLARREHSRSELFRKLTRYTEDNRQINLILDQLSSENLQSEQRFVEMMVHSKQEKHGSQYLSEIFRQHGIDEAIFMEWLPEKEDELSSAINVLNKKFRQPERDFIQQQKYYRFLLYRGFNHDVTRKAIQQWLDERCED